MRLAGVWVGWGLGDNSSRDFTVRKVKALMRKKFASYAGNLADTNLFDQQMFDAVWEMQRRYHEQGKLHEPNGILDLDTEIVMGYKQPAPEVLPIIFTVEGHLSSMFVGPCAFTAQVLEAQGVCHVKPIGYDNVALPFNNRSGIDELCHQLSLSAIEGPLDPAGRPIMWPFPSGTPWGLMSFSQGAIIGSEVLLDHLRPEGGSLHWRYKDLRRAIAFGNPYREKNVIAEWVPDPPAHDTQGISDVRIDNTPAFWKEHSRHGDLYAENTDDESGRLETSVYKAVQAEWTGDGSLFAALFRIFTQPASEILPLVKALLDGGMFLLNMSPHGTYNLAPCVEWMRGVK